MFRTIIIATFFTLCLLPSGAIARDTTLLKQAQTVYVPIYSHIYGGAKNKEIQLTATVSIRNTDPDTPLLIKEVSYYSTQGKLLKHYLQQPETIPPMATSRFIVKEADTTGGSGANFLVKWQAAKEIHAPLVEAIMISTRMQLGISFTSRGVVIEER
jgi:hypothetical protein